ncbi:MAG: NAD-dependent epimerase/dehydratase family protein [Anaerolineae bacterium]
MENPHDDCQTNVIGTLNLLEACRRTDDGQSGRAGEAVNTPPHPILPSPSRFVFASSNAPLGRQPPPATEDKAPLPISPYGASKLAGEGYCLAYHGSWGLGTVVLRFANVYGPYSLHKSSVVAQFFKDILSERQITIDGDGRQTRDFIYVEDLCRAILLALEANVSGEVLQIATGEETSILQLAETVQQVTGHSLEAHYGPARRGDIRKNYSTVTKASGALGWKPETGLHDGLHITWQWFRKSVR